MNFYADYVTTKLNAAIPACPVNRVEDYVPKIPGHDFTSKSEDELYLDNKLSTYYGRWFT